jgi:cytochrome b561
VHKALGLWILLAGMAWVFHWLIQPTPAPLSTQAKPLYRLAKLVHKLLLLLCIAMPLSGWVMVSAWSGRSIAILPGLHIPAITHKDEAFAHAMQGMHIVLAWTIIGLLALHVAGAFYHHWIKRDPILKRMIPRLRKPGGDYRFQFAKGVDIARKQR